MKWKKPKGIIPPYHRIKCPSCSNGGLGIRPMYATYHVWWSKELKRFIRAPRYESLMLYCYDCDFESVLEYRGR